jgi:hypothetical protein
VKKHTERMDFCSTNSHIVHFSYFSDTLSAATTGFFMAWFGESHISHLDVPGRFSKVHTSQLHGLSIALSFV